jgi:RNA polymerase sigma factor (sigma-70 family)
MTSATLFQPDSQAVHDRLVELWERTNDATLQHLAAGEPPVEGADITTRRQRDDWLSTGLMLVYQRTGDADVFALLFELNRESWLRTIKHRLRHVGACVDAEDVLQEAVLSMMRYPRRFHGDCAEALRRWSHGILRNTIVGQGRAVARQPSTLDFDDDETGVQFEDRHTCPPERAASQHECAAIVDQAYVIFLALYLAHFQRLPARTQRVLESVEIGHRPYRELAAEIGVPVANLKMIVFRGRRQIFRGMLESLAAIERRQPALS